jgi:hypothetical protein
MDVAAAPGIVRGRTIFISALNLVHPSIIPASSSVSGISAKKPLIIQTANGTLKKEVAIIMGKYVPEISRYLAIIKKGRTITIGGVILARRIMNERVLEYFHLNLDNAYAAGNPNPKAIPVEHKVTIILLKKALTSSGVLKK